MSMAEDVGLDNCPGNKENTNVIYHSDLRSFCEFKITVDGFRERNERQDQGHGSNDCPNLQVLRTACRIQA